LGHQKVVDSADFWMQLGSNPERAQVQCGLAVERLNTCGRRKGGLFEKHLAGVLGTAV
jgi:hypothetical protein